MAIFDLDEGGLAHIAKGRHPTSDRHRLRVAPVGEIRFALLEAVAGRGGRVGSLRPRRVRLNTSGAHLARLRLPLLQHPLPADLRGGLPQGDRHLRGERLQLRDEERIVLTLRYWKDMPVDDIADVMGKSVAAIRKQLLRAQQRLKELMLKGVDV